MTTPSEFQVGDYLANRLEKIHAGSNIFEHPTTQAEADARQHVGLLALTAIDSRVSDADRLNAVRHLLVCDPVRALAVVIDMASNGFTAMDGIMGMREGAAIDGMREMDRIIDAGGDPDAIDWTKYEAR